MFFKTLQRSWQNISRPRFQEKPLDEFHESCLRIARVDLEEILIMGGFDRNAKGMKTVAQALSELVNSLVPAFIQIGLESECAKIIVEKRLSKA